MRCALCPHSHLTSQVRWGIGHPRDHTVTVLGRTLKCLPEFWTITSSIIHWLSISEASHKMYWTSFFFNSMQFISPVLPLNLCLYCINEIFRSFELLCMHSTYIQTRTYICTCVHTCKHKPYTYTHTYTHMHMCTCTPIFTQTYTPHNVHICIHVPLRKWWLSFLNAPFGEGWPFFVGCAWTSDLTPWISMSDACLDMTHGHRGLEI